MRLQSKSSLPMKFAFTLIEIVLVLAIFGILFTMASLSFKNYKKMRTTPRQKLFLKASTIKSTLSLIIARQLEVMAADQPRSAPTSGRHILAKMQKVKNSSP